MRRDGIGCEARFGPGRRLGFSRTHQNILVQSAAQRFLSDTQPRPLANSPRSSLQHRQHETHRVVSSLNHRPIPNRSHRRIVYMFVRSCKRYNQHRWKHSDDDGDVFPATFLASSRSNRVYEATWKKESSHSVSRHRYRQDRLSRRLPKRIGLKVTPRWPERRGYRDKFATLCMAKGK